MKKHTVSIQIKMIISYAMICVVCMLFYFAYTSMSLGRMIRTEKTAEYANNAMLVANSIETRLNNTTNYANMFVSDITIQSLLRNPMGIAEQLNAVIDRVDIPFALYEAQDSTVLGIMLYTDNRDILVSSDYITITDTYEEVNGDPSGLLWQISDDNRELSLVMPVFYLYVHSTEPAGYLKIDLDASMIFREALADSDSNLLMQIAEGDGRRIFESWRDLEADKIQNPVTVAEIPLKNTGFTTTFSVPASVFHSAAADILRNSALALAACLLLAGVCILVSVWMLTGRIRKLIRIVEDINQSNLDLTIDMKQNDEIGILSNCLNTMLRRINRLIEDICRTKDAEKQAELESLRAQINLHFLYNAMDTINWMALKGTVDPICDVTALLSKYYRTMLNQGEFYTTLARELENIRSYIGIQQILHSNSFDVEYDCEEELLEYEVPNFILQPAVENAIVHGIDPVSSRRCRLRIELHSIEDKIRIRICDDGAGLTKESCQELNNDILNGGKNGGYGLGNVQERIHLAFGGEFGVTVSGEPDKGAQTVFVLPRFKRNTLKNYSGE